MISSKQLVRLGVDQDTADLWAPAFDSACNQYGIDTSMRLAHFFGQIMVESAQLTQFEENLNYSVGALLKQWPRRFSAEAANAYGRKKGQPADQQMIANIAYANRMGNGPASSGDGWTYRGFGPKQLTGKENHRNFADYHGLVFYEYDPRILTEPEWGSLSAAWFWATNGLNELADINNAAEVTRVVNGGHNGIRERIDFTELGLEVVFA